MIRKIRKYNNLLALLVISAKVLDILGVGYQLLVQSGQLVFSGTYCALDLVRTFTVGAQDSRTWISGC